MSESLISESSDTNRRRLRSVAWEHFKKINNSQDKAECLYCGAIIGCSSTQDTSGTHNHLRRCKNYPYANMEKRQRSSSNESIGVGSSILAGLWKFDQDAS